MWLRTVYKTIPAAEKGWHQLPGMFSHSVPAHTDELAGPSLGTVPTLLVHYPLWFKKMVLNHLEGNASVRKT